MYKIGLVYRTAYLLGSVVEVASGVSGVSEFKSTNSIFCFCKNVFEKVIKKKFRQEFADVKGSLATRISYRTGTVCYRYSQYV